MITVKVKNVASYPAIGIKSNETIMDAVNLMNKEGIGAIIVYSGDEAVGIVTERDIMLNFLKDKNTKISEVMSSPIITIDEEESVGKTVQMMLSRSIRRLGVTDDKENLVGFINLRDIIQGVHESFLSMFEVT